MTSAVNLLERAAALWSERTAVEDERGSVSFGELLRRARAIGSELLRGGAGGPVLVYIPKSIDALCAMLGTLCAGLPYVPVDVHMPEARLDRILSNLRPSRIITLPELLPTIESRELYGGQALPLNKLLGGNAQDEAVTEAIARVKPTDPAYIIYTSGSTGAPKGVTIPHEGVLSYADWVIDTFGFNPDSVMASQAPFYFDNSVYDIYGMLRSGARLVLIPEKLLLFPSKIPQFLAEKHISAVFWVPTVMINMANAGVLGQTPLPELQTVCFAGEVMPNRALNAWRRAYPHCRYANLYGPTEITDVCVYYIVDREFSDAEPLPIGRVCENMGAVILNESGAVCEAGEVGELCIYGPGVALGYWRAPELTERAFTDDPSCPGRRIYRTGDLAYTAADGLIMYVGRRDGQVKVKGNRIELGEIENAAQCVEGVLNCCAVFDSAAQEIVLFVETRNEIAPRAFGRELRRYIPAYMLPSRIIGMEKLPYNANGKIDRAALAAQIRKDV